MGRWSRGGRGRRKNRAPSKPALPNLRKTCTQDCNHDAAVATMMFLTTLMFAHVSFAGARGHEERCPSGLMRRTPSQSHSTSTGLFYWEPAAPPTVCNVREGPTAVAPI